MFHSFNSLTKPTETIPNNLRDLISHISHVRAGQLSQLSDLKSPSEFISGSVWVGNDIIRDGDLSRCTYVITLSDAKRADSRPLSAKSASSSREYASNSRFASRKYAPVNYILPGRIGQSTNAYLVT